MLNSSSDRRNRAHPADRRSHAAVRSAAPLVMNGLRPADMSGRRASTEPRIANAICVALAEAATRAFDLLQPALGGYLVRPVVAG